MLVGKRSGNKNFWWAIHNVIAHPLSELFFWLRLNQASNWIHEETIPIHDTEESGRG